MSEKKLCQILEWFSDAGVSDITANVNLSCNETPKEAFTLRDLKEMVAKVDTPLRNCALNMVFGTGNENAEILLLGEAPGAEEDRQGIPFVGQSGQLLDRILAAVGLDRTKIYITNILPWRPPGNRTPTNQEIELFRPYVLKHISLINPRVVICLGGTAAKALLQTTKGIVQLRGIWTKIDEISAKILPTFHPAYLLRSPSQKREVWLDFLSATDFSQK
ncbi:MAG: uracil-DNA glycosylase [Holosporaceae bacterium]|jgi:DNA polymerase|nr:uracil-DNA glycosylase [Holosporaceae bacterium]